MKNQTSPIAPETIVAEPPADKTIADEPIVNETIAAEHGLSPQEYKTLRKILERTPNYLELGIFSVMWSEHCSYKSSRKWLKTLPTESPHVICGPGENAGIINLGRGLACIFKIESHNHPSFIEPYQGAATGVGGIMRDVFTMGARPIANLDALIFGDPKAPRMQSLINGVIRGIGGYGNCFGVPTVGGLTEFEPSCNGNILVNAMCVGLTDTDKIFYAKAAGIGNKVIYVGAKTGPDGIHGATMASAQFDDEEETRRPTVQVGDPFSGKLLLEACLELMASGKVIAIQDMGAAGLTCSSVEMADKGGVGMRMNLEKVPLRDSNMSPYEIMLSESQERMLMVLRPEDIGYAQEIFDKWDLDFAEIGELTDSGKLELFLHADKIAEIPIKAVVENSPIYDRPYELPLPPQAVSVTEIADSPLAILQKFLNSEHFAHREWMTRQYDYLIRGETYVPPGLAAASVVAIPENNRNAKTNELHETRALGLVLTACGRVCYADPHSGGKQIVAQAWRSLIAVGAEPMALTNNLNFGNPEKPNIMGQFVGVISGMGAACEALQFPVVSGNVSLYNETSDRSILPLPVIGGVGLISDKARIAHRGNAKNRDKAWLIGDPNASLNNSRYQVILHGKSEGAVPPLDLDNERKVGAAVLQAIGSGAVHTADAVGDGGLLVSLFKMCEASDIGIELDSAISGESHAFFFAEHQSCYIIGADEATVDSLKKQGIAVRFLGQFGGDKIIMGDEAIQLEVLRKINRKWFANYMETF